MAESTYVVKKGDTLSGIAKQLGISNWRTLYDLNKATIGSNPNLIKVGQTLTYGASPAPASAPTSAPAGTPTGGGFTMDMLTSAYQKLLGRTPDPSGIAEYTSSRYAGKTINDLEKIIMSSPEYQQKSANPSTTDEVAKRLADVNSMAFDKFQVAEAPTVRTTEQIKQEITSQLPPETDKPVAPKLEEMFNKLSGELGITELEDFSTELKTQKDELWAQYRALVYDERGKPILNRLIQGRTSQAARDLQEQLDFITRQESEVNDKLTTRYNLVNLKMNFAQTDYQTAKAEYDSDYSRAISLINAISSEKSADKAELNAFKNDARANLTLYSKLFENGQLTWDGLTGDQKTQLNKLEVQAGLGLGYLRSVQSLSGGGEVKSITTRQAPDGYEYADAITVMPDGSLKVVSTQLGKFKQGGTGTASTGLTKREQSFLDDARGWVTKLADTKAGRVFGKDATDWGTAYNSMRSAYPEATSEQIDQALNYNEYYPKPVEQPAQTTQKSTGFWGSIKNFFTGKS